MHVFSDNLTLSVAYITVCFFFFSKPVVKLSSRYCSYGYPTVILYWSWSYKYESSFWTYLIPNTWTISFLLKQVVRCHVLQQLSIWKLNFSPVFWSKIKEVFFYMQYFCKTSSRTRFSQQVLTLSASLIAKGK